MPIATVNPATGQVVETFEPYDMSRCDAILDQAQHTQAIWTSLAIEDRAERLAPLAGLLRSRIEEYAELITLEMGKPITQARAEVEKCATCVDHFVQHGPTYLRSQAVPTDGRISEVRHLALGIVLGVMPWNYPFWQVLRFAVPTLLAGNGILLKHASNVPLAALALERLALDSGLPVALFSTVLTEGSAVIPLIHDSRVAAVSLTGSEEVGRRIGAEAGAALKPAVLELGGSDPFIVLSDADVSAAARAAALARTLNSGQSCIAAKRFIVADRVHDDFVSEMVAGLDALHAGDPMDPATELGPLARADLRDDVHHQVESTVKSGGDLLLGGVIPDGQGAFYPASLIVDVRPGMVGFDEELFGPVGVVVRASDENRMIELANMSRYGLGASVWSAETEHALRLGEGLHSGMVFVNGIVRSDPRLPFGGIKASGYGRELGAHGALEFVNVQATWVAP